MAIVAAVGGGTAAGIGGAASVGSSAAEGKKSAKRGREDETFSRFKLKQLKHTAKHEIDCLRNSTDGVRDCLAEHRCTSLDRNLFAVGDGHGNAAVISVARVWFPKKSDAEGCEKVEEVQGSGDIKPPRPCPARPRRREVLRAPLPVQSGRTADGGRRDGNRCRTS
ncbi:hypothetical protein CU254_35360 [Amycolatopsis sp. AA4]|uniref:hypothetical protein n=1 Tax=Actinomycetes TaxID=1760 RepID=UPI0001B55BDA|nr:MULTISPECIES: hypothetical protein [Actinomycetes]ATY15091.1 hypothetical protein CU254_35360 [Amycolatopsis sp. AA4]EFL11299.1 predicted protein [Streptomyces sp. AA4]